MNRVNVEVCAAFFDNGATGTDKPYKVGEVVALEENNAADLRAAGFVRPTTRVPPPPVAKGTYVRRDVKARK
jgi:hypothetical protein